MKMTQLENRAEEFWFKVIDADLIKEGISLLTGFLKVVTDLVDTLGLVPIALSGAGIGAFVKGFA